MVMALCGAEELNPRVVLDEAHAAYEKKDYASALQKVTWFWNNAVKIDQSLIGVRGSDARTLFYLIQKESPDGKALYVKTMNTALADSLADLTDPASMTGIQLPANHTNFLDYLALAEKVQSDEEIVDNFKKLDAVNPKLAKWEYAAVADHLLKEKEFTFMNKFVEPWPLKEKELISSMLMDYRMLRDSKMTEAGSLDYEVNNLRIIKIVYAQNGRKNDEMLLDFFCRMHLTDSERAEIDGPKGNF